MIWNINFWKRLFSQNLVNSTSFSFCGIRISRLTLQLKLIVSLIRDLFGSVKTKLCRERNKRKCQATHASNRHFKTSDHISSSIAFLWFYVLFKWSYQNCRLDNHLCGHHHPRPHRLIDTCARERLQLCEGKDPRVHGFRNFQCRPRSPQLTSLICCQSPNFQ